MSASGPWRSLYIIVIEAEGLLKDGHRPGGQGWFDPRPATQGEGALKLLLMSVNAGTGSDLPLHGVLSICGPSDGLPFARAWRPLMRYIKCNNVISFPLVSC